MPITSPLAPKKPKVDASGQLFSGMITDAAGRKQYYRNGEEAAAPKASSPAAAQPAAAPKTPKTEAATSAASKPAQPSAPKQPRQVNQAKAATYARQIVDKYGGYSEAIDGISRKMTEMEGTGNEERLAALKAVHEEVERLGKENAEGNSKHWQADDVEWSGDGPTTKALPPKDSSTPGFTGIDAHGHKWVNGIQVAIGRGEPSSGQETAYQPNRPKTGQPAASSPAAKQSPSQLANMMAREPKPATETAYQPNRQKAKDYALQLHQKFGDQAHAKIDAKLAELANTPGTESRQAALKAVKESLPNKPSSGAHEKILGSLDKSNLPDEQKKEYKGYATAALKAMPKEAHARIEKNLAKTDYFPDTMSLGLTTVGKLKPEITDRVKSGKAEIGGYYSAKEKRLALDGGGRANDGVGLYAHEMTHAIDGPNYEISKSPEWQESFKEEFANGQLTKYGSTKPTEALAEFGRALYGHKVKVDELRKQFPKAVAVFEKHGLLPE